MLQFMPPAPPARHASAPARSHAVPPDAATAAPKACSIVGDSIAAGLAGQMPECAASARIGMGSREILARTPRREGAATIISAGSNDPANPALGANLEAMRERSGGSPVLWIIPSHPVAAAAVAAVAARHGDRTLRLTGMPMRADGVHPASYAALAAAVRVRISVRAPRP